MGVHRHKLQGQNTSAHLSSSVQTREGGAGELGEKHVQDRTRLEGSTCNIADVDCRWHGTRGKGERFGLEGLEDQEARESKATGERGKARQRE